MEPSKTTTSTNTVDVVLNALVIESWKVIVNDEAHLVNVNASTEQISGNKHLCWFEQQ